MDGDNLVSLKRTPIADGNIQARLRMIYLYNLASIHKGLVLSTDNQTEYQLGFWTIHGDVGDFNPIHIGHISIVTTVLNANLVDKVIIIPAWHNPFKEHNPAPFMKRWEMCYQSTKGITNVQCAQVEGVLHDRLQVDKIPTYKVIDVYKNDPFFNGSEMYIITTSETFSEMPTWENGY